MGYRRFSRRVSCGSWGGYTCSRCSCAVSSVALGVFRMLLKYRAQRQRHAKPDEGDRRGGGGLSCYLQLRITNNTHSLA